MNTYLLNNVCADRATIEQFTSQLPGRLLSDAAGRRPGLPGDAGRLQAGPARPGHDGADAPARRRWSPSPGLPEPAALPVRHGARRRRVDHLSRRSAATCYQEGGIVSPDGHCRAFDAAASGTVFGSGVGVVVLKRLDDALADGDHDLRRDPRRRRSTTTAAAKVGFTAPSVDGQAEVDRGGARAGRRRARDDRLRRSARHRRRRSATRSRSPALTKAFAHDDRATGILRARLGQDQRRPSGRRRRRHRPDQDGAGADSTRCFRRRCISRRPTRRSTSTAVAVLRQHRARRRGRPARRPRRAGVSSFGVGGTNAHVVARGSARCRGGIRRRRCPAAARAVGAHAECRCRSARPSRGSHTPPSGSAPGRYRGDLAERPAAVQASARPRLHRRGRRPGEAGRRKPIGNRCGGDGRSGGAGLPVPRPGLAIPADGAGALRDRAGVPRRGRRVRGDSASARAASISGPISIPRDRKRRRARS